ncbi:MAG: hypothetical protein FJX47_08135 [Alphaproteobacteria bacterium]|nr:hypothetical protein [Alphaproteobacteria bacterium]
MNTSLRLLAVAALASVAACTSYNQPVAGGDFVQRKVGGDYIEGGGIKAGGNVVTAPGSTGAGNIVTAPGAAGGNVGGDIILPKGKKVGSD